MRPLLLLLFVVSTLSARADRALIMNRFRMHVGDDPAWASPGFDDSQWRPIELYKVPDVPDAYWLRARVDLARLNRPATRPLGIAFAGMASHEIWWDGERIGGGGTVSRTAAGEKPGPIQAMFQIPDRLASRGTHTLAVRLSAFHRHFTPHTGLWSIVIGDYSAIASAMERGAWLALIALSGILVTGAFAFAMYFINDRDRRSLLLGTLSLAAAALLLAESWRALFGYTYDWHIVRLIVVTFFTWLVSVQLVALVVARFPHRLGKRVVIATMTATALCSLLPMWDLKALAMFEIAVFITFAWMVAAALRRMPGSTLTLAGVTIVTIGLLADPMRFPESGLFFLLDALFVCLLFSHAVDVRRERSEKSDALVRSARLELELLKRQLQPHFLMNTLTALAEWIERDPKTAVRMIDSLSEEMRIFGDVAGQRLIPAEEELRLCRAHLETMELRRDVRYELLAEGFRGDELVPPGTFHTLVENAVTHGARQAVVTIRIVASSADGNVRFSVESPAGTGADDGTRSGVGTRYIEARLREAWGSRWSFAQRRDGTLWRADIVVPAAEPA